MHRYSNFNKLCLLISSSLILASPTAWSSNPKTITPKVIYGNDDRLDLHQVQNSQQLELASSTVMLVTASLLTKVGNRYTITSKTFGQDFGLCPEEPFYDQPDPAFCSGSLVGEDLVLTAGHCIENQTDCDTTRFVFGYSVNAPGVYPNSADEKDVVGCKSIVARKLEGQGADYALIKLNRKITHRTPLVVEKNSSLKPGDPIGVIGHPSGLPTKVSYGAEVRSTAPVGYFTTNLDTYGGNSGSAVFNANTGRIEGILVRGEVDFVLKGSCRVSKRCDSSACRGEDVTKIAEIAPLIP